MAVIEDTLLLQCHQCWITAGPPLDLSHLVLWFLVALALDGTSCFAAAPTVVTFPEADTGPLAGDVLGGLALA